MYKVSANIIGYRQTLSYCTVHQEECLLTECVPSILQNCIYRLIFSYCTGVIGKSSVFTDVQNGKGQ